MKKIKIYYVNGEVEEFYGKLSIGDKNILSIFPQCDRKGIHIPLINILKYEIGG